MATKIKDPLVTLQKLKERRLDEQRRLVAAAREALDAIDTALRAQEAALAAEVTVVDNHDATLALTMPAYLEAARLARHRLDEERVAAAAQMTAAQKELYERHADLKKTEQALEWKRTAWRIEDRRKERAENDAIGLGMVMRARTNAHRPGS